MTTIVYRDGEFAWDTQTTWIRAHFGSVKVFTNGGVTFGVSGKARTSDVLEFLDIPNRNTFDPNYDVRKWVITELVPAINSGLKSVGALEEVSGVSDTGSAVIISVDGLSGYLSGDGSFVQDDSGVLGVGSGSKYALGAIYAGASLEEAVTIATKLDMYSGGEIRTMKVGESND